MTDNYKILLFGKRNKYLGTIDEAFMSKATSFDLYYGKRYVGQANFQSKWTNRQKITLVRKVIREIEYKRLLKELIKKKPKDYRQVVLSLPKNLDYRLYNTAGKRIPSDSFSQAKYFEVWYRSPKTKKMKKSDAWEFSTVRLTIKEKMQIMKNIFNEFKLPAIEVRPIGEQKYDYTLEAFENGPFIRRDETISEHKGVLHKDGMALHEIIRFTEPVKITKDFDKKTNESNQKVSEVLKSEWKDFYKESENNTPLFNFRAKLEFVKPDGEITSQWIQTKRFPHQDQETFEGAYLDNFLDLINDAATGTSYMRASTGATSVNLAEIDFENQIY